MLTYGHLIEDLKTASKQLLITVSSLLNFYAYTLCLFISNQSQKVMNIILVR